MNSVEGQTSRKDAHEGVVQSCAVESVQKCKLILAQVKLDLDFVASDIDKLSYLLINIR